MIITIRVEDDDKSSEVTVNLTKHFPPMVHELRLLHTLLNQANAEISLARVFAGATSLGIDMYLRSHFEVRNEVLRKRFIDKLSEIPDYRS